MFSQYTKCFVLVTALLWVSCQTPLRTSRTTLHVKRFQDLVSKIENSSARLSLFQKFGPFRSTLRKNQTLKVTSDLSVDYDYFVPNHHDRAPLIIISHGNYSLKEAHRFQAERLASWGFYVMTLQLPYKRNWINNGKRIYKLTKYIAAWPEIFKEKIDTKKIILVGHSFGGSAISIAAGMGAPVAGLILLDPAIVSSYVFSKLKKIKVPVILLGADKKVFLSRQRKMFFDKIPKNIAEISVKGATHDDAQYPSMDSIYALGLDPKTSKKKQEYFLASILMTAFSYTIDEKLRFVWKALVNEKRHGRLVEAKIK